MFSRMSGRSIFGLRIEPRSPPVQVATWTSTPSATYLAVEAAPLLDSSSGWACTCISRSPARGCCGMGAILGVTLERVTRRTSGRPVRRPRPLAPPGGRRWRPSRWRLAFLGWLAWVDVRPARRRRWSSELVSFESTASTRSTAARRRQPEDEDVRATCLLRAFAEDHSVVGELTFTPAYGADRAARARPCAPSAGRPRVELVGCTAAASSSAAADRRRGSRRIGPAPTPSLVELVYLPLDTTGGRIARPMPPRPESPRPSTGAPHDAVQPSRARSG